MAEVFSLGGNIKNLFVSNLFCLLLAFSLYVQLFKTLLFFFF